MLARFSRARVIAEEYRKWVDAAYRLKKWMRKVLLRLGMLTLQERARLRMRRRALAIIRRFGLAFPPRRRWVRECDACTTLRAMVCRALVLRERHGAQRLAASMRRALCSARSYNLLYRFIPRVSAHWDATEWKAQRAAGKRIGAALARRTVLRERSAARKLGAYLRGALVLTAHRHQRRAGFRVMQLLRTKAPRVLVKSRKRRAIEQLQTHVRAVQLRAMFVAARDLAPTIAHLRSHALYVLCQKHGASTLTTAVKRRVAWQRLQHTRAAASVLGAALQALASRREVWESEKWRGEREERARARAEAAMGPDYSAQIRSRGVESSVGPGGTEPSILDSSGEYDDSFEEEDAEE